MNQKHLLLLLLVFILQASFFNTSKAAYILEGIPGETPEEQLSTWRIIKKSIQQQLWVEGKRIEEVSEIPAGITIHFVPDSLMQAFGLWKLHIKLVKKVRKKEPGLDRAYISDKKIPIKFIHTSWDSPGEGEEKKTNERIAKTFEEKREGLIAERFHPDRIDIDLANRIDKKSLSEDDDGTDIKQKTIIDWTLSLDFDDDEDVKDNYQFPQEKEFLMEYKALIKEKKWVEILDDFYPRLVLGVKRPHFTNLSHSAFTDPKFLETLDKDRGFLQAVVVFEQECEDKGMVTLLRGQKKFELSKSYYGGMHSFSFSRGYYFGILGGDSDASATYRARYEDVFLGFPARREVIQRFLFIPPFSWYTNLGLGGELWHPRTTVAIDTPYSTRTKEISIEGVSLYKPIDILGVLIKLQTFPNLPLKPSVHHYSKVIDYYTSTRRLYDKKAKKFKEPVSDIDTDTMIEIYRTVYPENAYLSGF